MKIFQKNVCIICLNNRWLKVYLLVFSYRKKGYQKKKKSLVPTDAWKDFDVSETRHFFFRSFGLNTYHICFYLIWFLFPKQTALINSDFFNDFCTLLFQKSQNYLTTINKKHGWSFERLWMQYTWAVLYAPVWRSYIRPWRTCAHTRCLPHCTTSSNKSVRPMSSLIYISSWGILSVKRCDVSRSLKFQKQFQYYK